MERAFGYSRDLATGEPVPYAQVAVYNAGTSNLATIYGDDLASPTPKANPFLADINGFFFFYGESGKYDLTLSGGTPDPIAVPYSWADVELGGAGEGIPGVAYASLPSPLQVGRLRRLTDREKGTYQATGTLWESLSARVVDVKMFNAVGDGVADDTAAVTAAIAAASFGGVVYFPPGTYNVAGPIVLPAGIRVQGANRYQTTLQDTSGAALFSVASTVPGTVQTRFVTIADIGLSGGAVSNNGTGIICSNVSYVVLDRCMVQNFAVGLSILGSHYITTQQTRLSNCTVAVNGNAANAQQPRQIVFANCQFDACVGNTFTWQTGNQIALHSCIFLDCGDAGLVVVKVSALTAGSGFMGISLIDCHILAPTGAAAISFDCADTRVIHSLLNCTIAGFNNTVGLKIGSTTATVRWIATNCYFNGSITDITAAATSVGQMFNVQAGSATLSGYYTAIPHPVSAEIRFGVGTREAARLDSSATANDTSLLLYDTTAGALVRVSRGIADSGGAGYRLLRIPN